VPPELGHAVPKQCGRALRAAGIQRFPEDDGIDLFRFRWKFAKEGGILRAFDGADGRVFRAIKSDQVASR
jgi:hypothetical protein